MVEVKNNNGEISLKMQGNLAEIATDALMILHAMYEAFYDEKPRAAELFAQAVVHELISPTSTIFEPIKKEGEQE